MRTWWKALTQEEIEMLKENVGVFWYEASGLITVRALLKVIKKLNAKEN